MNRLAAALTITVALGLAACADRAPLTDPHAQHRTPGPASYAEAFNKAVHGMHGAMPAQYVGDPDGEFARGMIPHHQGAIDMAEVVLRYGKDPAVRKLADDIKRAQAPEIAQMRAWLAKHGTAKRALRAEAATGYKAAADKMHAAMNIPPSTDADADFLRAMIPHHQGAIDMARVELRYGRDLELRSLAQAIVAGQTKEISQMQAMLAARKK